MHGYISNILKKGPIPEHKNFFKGTKCTKTHEIIGKGVYCTPKFSTAQANTEKFNLNGKFYRLIMMCKVCPKGVKYTNHPDIYWVVEKTKYIRLEALLLKEE